MSPHTPHEVSMARLIDAITRATEANSAILTYVSVLTQKDKLLGVPSPTTRQSMSVKEFAQSIGVSAATVYKSCHKGEIPCSKIGKQYVIDPDEALESAKKWRKASHK